MATLWGIDVGGTKLEGVVLDAENRQELARIRIATEADRGYGHIVGRIAELVGLMEEAAGERRADRIGFGTPGSTEPTTGLLRGSNTVCLNGQPFGRDLSEATGAEAVLANDANCFALAEALHGSAQGYEVVFGVIMGTGVGGGVVVRGQVLNGRHGIAGEWGHNVLHPEGPPCYCGKRGCVERCISGPAIETADGRGLRLPEIVARNDAESRATVERLCRDFGQALGVVVNILDPDAIVLGGGVGNVDALYTRGREELARWVFHPEHPTPPLLRPALGDSAGVIGAALLVG